MKKKIFKIILYLLLICLLIAIYSATSIYLYSNKDETKKANAAIILGAGVYGDKPSPVFLERINHGIWLYKNNYVDKLIFTGGVGEGKKYSESVVAKKYAIENGIAEANIFIEEKSTITQDNLANVTKIINDNSISSVLIVSDPLHMKRAMLMAKDNNFNAYSSPTRTTKYTTFESKSEFLLRETFFYIGYRIYRISPCTP